MRLTHLVMRDVPPVRRFEAGDLSDVVVIAGPNGVGKTRLMQSVLERLRSASPQPGMTGLLVATCAEEREQWGKAQLDIAVPEDMQLLSLMLSAGRRRRNWQSSLINFESDRTVQNLQPYPFTFDMPDPSEEQVDPGMTFTPLKQRYHDTIHSMHRMVEAQRRNISTRAIQLQREGKTSMNLNFTDPMAPFKDVFRQLLAPKELADLTMGDQRLKYIHDGQPTLDFDSLSSGEREVVNIAFDFLLRRPRDCIVFFDEPELHLHPELSYKLVQTLSTIGSNNQFVFTTHSPDIITASLDRSVIFLGPVDDDATSDSDGAPNQAIAVNEADETHQALKLLGQSIGIVALGRKIVLIEGTAASLDKQVYGSILRQRFSDLVLVPSGGKHAIESFGHVHSAVLSKSLWGVEFFMLCDGDSRPPGDSSSDRLAILPRYHLENYFLDEVVWARAFAKLEAEGSWLTSDDAIREKLRELAADQISLAVALRVASDIRLRAGNVSVMPKGCNGLTASELAASMGGKLEAEEARLREALDRSSMTADVEREFERIQASLDNDTDEWKELVPGRPLLAGFAREAGLGVGHAKTLYVNTALEMESAVFDDIAAIFKAFAEA